MRTATTLLVLVALVAGCGAASGDRRAGPRPEVGYPFGGAAHVPAAERATHTAAEDVLIAGCMRRRGFAYRAPAGVRPARPDAANPYGLLTEDEARVHGYRVAEDLLAPAAAGDDPNEGTRQALSPARRAAWDAALLGTEAHQEEIRVADGGVFTYRSDACAHEARRQIVGPDWDVLYLTVQAAANAVIDEVLRSAQVGRAQVGWAACMRERGHRMATPADARRVVAEAFARAGRASTGAVRLEQSVATADAACQRRSGLWAAVAEAQRAAEARQPESVRSAAARLRAARVAALDTARALAPAHDR